MITLRSIAEAVRRALAMQARQRIAEGKLAEAAAALHAQAELDREQQQLDELAAQIMRRQRKYS